MKVLLRPVFHHVLKTAACFPLNLRPALSMLQCSKWLDLEAFGLYDPGPAATFPQDQDLFSWLRPTVLTTPPPRPSRRLPSCRLSMPPRSPRRSSCPVLTSPPFWTYSAATSRR